MILDKAPTWKPDLLGEFDKPYMLEFKKFLKAEKEQQKIIYPHSSNWFHSLESTPLDQVKVVIIAQDPYHQPDQAHGLCFSVLPGIKPPPSLVNIYKELEQDLNIKPVNHGYLENWAQQGVLLLNAVLTVEASKPNAHQGKGWEIFTDKVISTINSKCQHVVFLLWGSYAQKKGAIIDDKKHLVLKAPHPSPLSAHRGFFGCQHFSQANHYLMKNGKTRVNWQLEIIV